MKHIKEFIIEEGIKDKIKSFINKFKKEKVPEKVWTDDDLLEYKDKEVTEKEALEIAEIYIKINHITVRTSDFEKRSFAQGILDCAWQNDKKDKLTHKDNFGEEHGKKGYRRANLENGYESNEVGVGMSFFEPFLWGWCCAEKLNLKYTAKEEPKVNLKRN